MAAATATSASIARITASTSASTDTLTNLGSIAAAIIAAIIASFGKITGTTTVMRGATTAAGTIGMATPPTKATTGIEDTATGPTIVAGS